jgi:hypothetical protein
MKATIELPDDLYREVKAESAREGLTVREVTIRLFGQWLDERKSPATPAPSVNWRKFRAPLAHLLPKNRPDHSLSAVRKSIVKHWNEPL